MASRRKLPLVLFLITLVLLAGAVVLLLRGRPVTLERIAARQGYAITGQEEATVTLTLSREGGQLLLPYRIDEDGGITAQLRVSDLPVQADGEDRPDAARLASQGPGEQFALYVDRALFLRSDTITIQLGSFYRLTYAPA